MQMARCVLLKFWKMLHAGVRVGCTPQVFVQRHPWTTQEKRARQVEHAGTWVLAAGFGMIFGGGLVGYAYHVVLAI
jgi:hypothetical protein